ncbi:MAG: hypothetical protein KGZ25_07790 [Planctomycetes bacterium]|nr:hypothetical protein [Planctomycetota bacterium]
MRYVLLALAVVFAAGCLGTPDWEPVEYGAIRSTADRAGENRSWKRPDTVPPEPARRTGNVVISVERRVFSGADQINFSTLWRYANNNIVVKGGHIARRNGLYVGGSTGNFRAALQTIARKSQNVKRSRAHIVTLSGHSARIKVGQQTYVETLRFRAPQRNIVMLERAFVGASLSVRPNVLPQNRLRIVLQPVFTTKKGRKVEITDMATEVIVRHGQQMVIGGLDESSDSAGYTLFHSGRGRKSQKSVLILTAFIQ